MSDESNLEATVDEAGLDNLQASIDAAQDEGDTKLANRLYREQMGVEPEEAGLESIGFTIYSLPTDVQARIDYLHMIAEEIIAKVPKD